MRAKSVTGNSGSKTLRSFSWLKSKVDSTEWQDLKSVDDLWKIYPQRIRFLFRELDFDKAGLDSIKENIQEGDTLAAVKGLVKYYKNSNSGFWLREPEFNREDNTAIDRADLLLENTVSFSDNKVDIPIDSSGGWKWNYKGPDKDKEFAYSLNGHQYLTSFLKAWKETGKETYVDKFDWIIKNWTVQNPLPSKKDSMYVVLTTSTETLDWRDISEVRWRDIEAGQRMGEIWPQAFYGFQQSDSFTPAARILMLASIAEHAKYLKEYHKKGHNWTTMEMNGLALVGLAFPEFKKADSWVSYARKVMQKEINTQVYPDGLQTELSTKTQWVALQRFESIATSLQNANRSVPSEYMKRLEEMYKYLAYSMRPDGHQPLNNDSDREDLRPRVLKAAEKYDRPDWEWIATNAASGKKPQGLPSRVFPWAGIHIMRDGWGQNAQWSFFDTGPFGTGHQHSDKLHLSVAAYGKDLLVDGGRYTHENYFSFDPATWRGYFRSSFSHNVILVDGHGQTKETKKADNPLTEGKDYINKSDFDYGRGTYVGKYNEVEGNPEHTRAVFYLKDKYWIVIDHIDTDQPRKLQTLWHYGPDLPVQQQGSGVVSTNSSGANLRITPIGKQDWETQIIKGQTDPIKQGWYSAEYGKKVPIPTAVFKTSIDGDATFGWVLTPSQGGAPPVKAKLLKAGQQQVKVRIEQKNEKPTTVTIPLDGTESPEIRTN